MGEESRFGGQMTREENVRVKKKNGAPAGKANSWKKDATISKQAQGA